MIYNARCFAPAGGKHEQRTQKNSSFHQRKYGAGSRRVHRIGRSRLHADGEGISPDFEGILQQNGRTYFKAVFRSEQYLFGLEGATRVQKNYAFLLSDLIENSSSRAVNLPKGEFVRRILLGECAPSDVQKYRVKYSVPDLPCFVLAVAAEEKLRTSSPSFRST